MKVRCIIGGMTFHKGSAGSLGSNGEKLIKGNIYTVISSHKSSYEEYYRLEEIDPEKYTPYASRFEVVLEEEVENSKTLDELFEEKVKMSRNEI